jgi:hypothetical protein
MQDEQQNQNQPVQEQQPKPQGRIVELAAKIDLSSGLAIQAPPQQEPQNQ